METIRFDYRPTRFGNENEGENFTPSALKK